MLVHFFNDTNLLFFIDIIKNVLINHLYKWWFFFVCFILKSKFIIHFIILHKIIKGISVTFDNFFLQTTFPHLFSVLYLSDNKLWDKFAKSSHCEQELPSSVASKISIFQQLLLVQALRPDRLYSASALFASRALGTFCLIFLFTVVEFFTLFIYFACV